MVAHETKLAEPTNYLSAARNLASLIETDALRPDREPRMSDAIAEALADSDLNWMMVPTAFGGGGADLLTGLEVIEEVARADGATGWAFFVQMTSTALCCAFLCDAAVQAIFGSDERPLAVGVLAPLGAIRRTESGYTVTGRYSFGSGIHQATWVLVGGLLHGAEGPEKGPGGAPRHLAVCVPKSQVELAGNWDVLGLEATGSVDFAVTEATTPLDFSFDMPDPIPLRGALSNVGLRGIAAAGHAAVALGIARRALDEIALLSTARQRPGSPRVADQQLFRYDFAVNDAAIRAARAFLWEVTRDAMETALEGKVLSAEQYQRIRQSCSYTHRVAVDAVRFAYEWSGSTGLRRPNAIGNCLLDISGATQHKYVDPNSLVEAADVLLETTRLRGDGLKS